MHLDAVKSICIDCSSIKPVSAGIFARKIGRTLTTNTAALIPKNIGCFICKSTKVDIYYPNRNQKIVDQENIVACSICKNPIPLNFINNFKNADFCPTCLLDRKVTETQISGATGGLFDEDLYRELSFFVKENRDVYLYWLRRAANTNDIHALSAIADMLSKSTNPEEIDEALNSYSRILELSNDENTINKTLQKIATVNLKEKNQNTNINYGIQLLNQLADKKWFYALYDLAYYTYFGKHNIEINQKRSFDLYLRAHEAKPDHFPACAVVAIMLLKGIGTERNLIDGKNKLICSIDNYFKYIEYNLSFSKEFDKIKCADEIMLLINEKDIDENFLKNARKFLNSAINHNVPDIIESLLQRCGGRVPSRQMFWELSVQNISIGDVKNYIYSVTCPESDNSMRLYGSRKLGQVEMLSNRKWISTTVDGIAVGAKFETQKEACLALAQFLNCDAPYIDPIEYFRRMRESRIEKRAIDE